MRELSKVFFLVSFNLIVFSRLKYMASSKKYAFNCHRCKSVILLYWIFVHNFILYNHCISRVNLDFFFSSWRRKSKTLTNFRSYFQVFEGFRLQNHRVRKWKCGCMIFSQYVFVYGTTYTKKKKQPKLQIFIRTVQHPYFFIFTFSEKVFVVLLFSFFFFNIISAHFYNFCFVCWITRIDSSSSNVNCLFFFFF